MKQFLHTTILVLLPLLFSCSKPQENSIFIEAENFDIKGGWNVDQQFMDIMGSTYLLAHGMGVPVSDAVTSVELPSKGEYDIFVRTFNWTSPWFNGEGPGKFNILINGKSTGLVLGNSGEKWIWQKAGRINVDNKLISMSLQDLTGFDGRVDAIYFTKDGKAPTNDFKKIQLLRREQLGKLSTLQNAGEFDLVVIGAGVAGISTAISAARLGIKVALIHDRPVLGGNNSSEVRVHLGGRIKLEPYSALGDVVNEIAPLRGGNAQSAEYYEDNKKMEMVLAEKNISLFTNNRAYDVKTDGNRIVEVISRDIETSEELSFKAPLFADCTGDGNIGYLAGADYAMGRESKSEFGESTAPEKSDKMTMGSSVQWYSIETERASRFPEFNYGIEFNESNMQKVTMGEWNWETGMNYDQISEFEKIRDYGLLVVFSNWSYLKNNSSIKDEYKKRRLEWVAYISGKRESRRLLGDIILKEHDITDFKIYPDASASTSWSIDLHYPDPKNTEDFPNSEFKSIAKHIQIHPYPLPYRCFYSRNIDNLFMAGRNISVSHVVLGTTRVMRTTGMIGEVVGMAASIASKYNTNPRGVYSDHLDELKKLMEKGVGKYNMKNRQKYNQGGTLGNKVIEIKKL